MVNKVHYGLARQWICIGKDHLKMVVESEGEQLQLVAIAS